jgi:hypothetical protein
MLFVTNIQSLGIAEALGLVTSLRTGECKNLIYFSPGELGLICILLPLQWL